MSVPSQKTGTCTGDEHLTVNHAVKFCSSGTRKIAGGNEEEKGTETA